jgi:hypothetical protein
VNVRAIGGLVAHDTRDGKQLAKIVKARVIQPTAMQFAQVLLDCIS